MSSKTVNFFGDEIEVLNFDAQGFLIPVANWESPKVTVTIPTFNRSDLLKRAINSVGSQKYRAIQIFVSDNASTDGTEQVVGEFVSRGYPVEYVRHPTNKGMLPNWDFAISRVSTDLFLILADDDYLLPTCIDSLVESIRSEPNRGMAFGITVMVDSAFNIFSTAPSQPGNLIRKKGLDLMTQSVQTPCSTGCLFSKTHLTEVGGFLQSSGFVADLCLMYRLSSRFRVGYVPTPVAVYSPGQSIGTVDFFKAWFPGLNTTLDYWEVQGFRGSRAHAQLAARSTAYGILALVRPGLKSDANGWSRAKTLVSIIRRVPFKRVTFFVTEFFRVGWHLLLLRRHKGRTVSASLEDPALNVAKQYIRSLNHIRTTEST